MTEKPLSGQVAVVTGAAKNIGREIALMLAMDGTSVVINGKSDKAAADAVMAEIEKTGGTAIVHMADVADPAQAEGLIEGAVEKFGRLDILVINAGMRRQNSIVDIPLSEWREVMTMDLESPFVLAKAALPHMLKNGQGRVVTLGGTSAHTGNIGRAHVGAAKMGLLSLTRSIAVEFGSRGVTANMVAPGHIDTVRGEAAGQRSNSGAGRPIQRMGKTSEIAAMVRHLCRPEGGYITGQCIHVDGGIYLGGA